eukprot:TRINITY_DN1282_c0_g1_i1.p1 TRINITY_DN1282_c0_g1~~TRINITY_DN1282_c0_g1_i1.p1  ORF type:complete len:186 (+),score=44.53 TRINITY_DN1282_c0_g1_i1:58-615(+)
MNHLKHEFQLSQLISNEYPSLGRFLNQEFLLRSLYSEIDISEECLTQICPKCHSTLIPGVNSKVRIQKCDDKLVNNKINVKCLLCNKYFMFDGVKKSYLQERKRSFMSKDESWEDIMNSTGDNSVKKVKIGKNKDKNANSHTKNGTINVNAARNAKQGKISKKSNKKGTFKQERSRTSGKVSFFK